MFKAEQLAANARSGNLAAAPIEVRSALDRKAKIAVAAPPPPAQVVDFEPESEAGDDDAVPEWPNAAAEDAMRVEMAQRETSSPQPRSRAGKDNTLQGGPLPKLDDIVAGIPQKVKDTLDELFRARFESVRRVPAAVLKTELKTKTED